ncbi:Uncharacterised protein [Bordetella pertussis]|nr:Uncharacterised protein [Bordetella pertussis]
MPPSVTLHASMAPVFMLCMVCSSSRVSMRPTLCRSMACPPAMPWLPAARARTWAACTTSAGAIGMPASSSKASGCRASPASMAVASSNCTCTVGRPRRSVSSSMHGRSSCTSE